MKRILGVLLALILVGGIVAGCSSPPSPTSTPTPTGTVAEGPEVGKLAPSFELTGLDGKSVSLQSLRGKPVLLNFWTTW
jgi:cytochrome c biogenesis protein CcmG, thiol:disulfide interchange protein DsbE